MKHYLTSNHYPTLLNLIKQNINVIAFTIENQPIYNQYSAVNIYYNHTHQYATVKHGPEITKINLSQNPELFFSYCHKIQLHFIPPNNNLTHTP